MQGIKSIVSCIKSSHVCLESTFPSKMLIFINVHIEISRTAEDIKTMYDEIEMKNPKGLFN